MNMHRIERDEFCSTFLLQKTRCFLLFPWNIAVLFLHKSLSFAESCYGRLVFTVSDTLKPSSVSVALMSESAAYLNFQPAAKLKLVGVEQYNQHINIFFLNKQYKINKRRREKFKWEISDLVSLKHIHPRFGRRNQHLSLATGFGKLSWVLQAKPPEASSSISDNRGMTYKRIQTADYMPDGIHKRIWTPDVPSCHCIKVQVFHNSCVLDARHRQVYQMS